MTKSKGEHLFTKTTDYLTKNDIAMIPHFPYSPDSVPADYFLFPKVKFSFKDF